VDRPGGDIAGNHHAWMGHAELQDLMRTEWRSEAITRSLPSDLSASGPGRGLPFWSLTGSPQGTRPATKAMLRRFGPYVERASWPPDLSRALPCRR
jgi:hypothetical protein